MGSRKRKTGKESRCPGKESTAGHVPDRYDGRGKEEFKMSPRSQVEQARRRRSLTEVEMPGKCYLDGRFWSIVLGRLHGK